jgi:hypothetical protein
MLANSRHTGFLASRGGTLHVFKLNLFFRAVTNHLSGGAFNVAMKCHLNIRLFDHLVPLEHTERLPNRDRADCFAHERMATENGRTRTTADDDHSRLHCCAYIERYMPDMLRRRRPHIVADDPASWHLEDGKLGKSRPFSPNASRSSNS